MNVFVFIGIGVNFALFCLGLGIRIKLILLAILSECLKSVPNSTGTLFICFWSMNAIKPMRASDRPVFLCGVLLPVQLILDCHWLVCVPGAGLTERSLSRLEPYYCRQIWSCWSFSFKTDTFWTLSSREKATLSTFSTADARGDWQSTPSSHLRAVTCRVNGLLRPNACFQPQTTSLQVSESHTKSQLVWGPFGRKLNSRTLDVPSASVSHGLLWWPVSPLSLKSEYGLHVHPLTPK